MRYTTFYRGAKREKIVLGERRVVQPLAVCNREFMGIDLRYEGGGGLRYGWMYPQPILATYRAVKIAELIEEIGPYTLGSCWSAGHRDFDDEHTQEAIEKAGQCQRALIVNTLLPPNLDSILAMMIQRKIPFSRDELIGEVIHNGLRPTRRIRLLINAYLKKEELFPYEKSHTGLVDYRQAAARIRRLSYGDQIGAYCLATFEEHTDPTTRIAIGHRERWFYTRNITVDYLIAKSKKGGIEIILKGANDPPMHSMVEIILNHGRDTKASIEKSPVLAEIFYPPGRYGSGASISLTEDRGSCGYLTDGVLHSPNLTLDIHDKKVERLAKTMYCALKRRQSAVLAAMPSASQGIR